MNDVVYTLTFQCVPESLLQSEHLNINMSEWHKFEYHGEYQSLEDYIYFR